MKVKAVETLNEIKTKLHESSDLKSRSVQFFGKQVEICYIADITDNMLLNDTIIHPLLSAENEDNSCNEKDKFSELEKEKNKEQHATQNKAENSDKNSNNDSNENESQNINKNELKDSNENVEENLNKNENIKIALENTLSTIELTKAKEIDTAIEKLLSGNALILLDGADEILCCDIEKIVVRAIAEPPTSTVIKGPREGFNESLKYNLALLRRRVKSDDFVVNTMSIGELTKTDVALVYFDSLADKKIVKQITQTLKKIKIDGVVDSHYLVSFLQKNPKSLFKQVGDVEKPDILLGKMLEGRVGIIVDGSPIVLTLPYIIIEDLQNSDDYYSQPIRVTFVRILRLVGVILAVLLPGVYVALERFHYKIIPLEFLVTIINTTQGIPFSPFVELLFIVLLFEILYEANLRMPQYLGTAVSIVGALILGDTAISAGLVSPPAVMIVALSGITFYIIPGQAAQFSILRLVALVVGACLGLFGILLFCVFVLSYLSSFDSYKSAYLAPSAPFIKSDQKDLFVRKTIKDMTKRPRSIANNRENLDRRDDDD